MGYTNARFQKDVLIFGFLKNYIVKKYEVILLLAIYRSNRSKRNDILGIPSKILSQKYAIKIFQNLTLFDLTSVKSQIG